MALQCARNGAQILITVIIYVLKSTKETEMRHTNRCIENRCRKEFLDDRNVIQE